VLKGDRDLPLDQQTRFILRPLSQAEQVAAEDEVYYLAFDGTGTKSHVSREKRVARQLALSHIEAIENFPVGAPKPWPSDPEKRDEYLEQLRSEDVLEVGNEIFTRSKLGAEAEALKNSSPPAPTSGSGGTSEATTAPATTG
jgi:hypothetical protein